MNRKHCFARYRHTLLICLLSLPMLGACTKPVGVSIHGVNYTGEEFSYSIQDPADANNQGGGEVVEPFAAGGTMCCYVLPRQWHPGIKIKINVTHWLAKKLDGSRPEVHDEQVVDVPPYVDGKPGELWVLRNADGTMGVVSSDYQPDHEKWPGKVKGWPVPSLAYQRERWDLYIKLAEDDVEAAQDLISELEKSPNTRAATAWNFEMNGNADKTYRGNPRSLEGFSGPTDPKFQAKLKQEYFEWLETSQHKLKRLKESRP